MKTNKKTVAVIFGGISPEHDVSIITGVQVLNKLDKSLYSAVPIYVSKTGKWFTHQDLFNINTYKNIDAIFDFANEVIIKTGNDGGLFVKNGYILKSLKNLNIDIVFPCMHGDIGEGGGLQGLCEILGLPYVGSNILGSALGIDKTKTRQIIFDEGMKNINYVVLLKSEWLNNKEKVKKSVLSKINLPLIVKPSSCGSSIGITIVKDIASFDDAVEVALTFDTKLIVEEYLMNYKEINISVMGNSGEEVKASVCEEVFHTKEFLSFKDKYLSKDANTKGILATKRKIPAEIPESLHKELEKTAKKIFIQLNLSGCARIDFLVNPMNNDYILIEANTIPGSMAFYLWEASGIKFTDLITTLIDLAEKRKEQRDNLIKFFKSSILTDMKNSIKSNKLIG